jgi:hypothetical protein
VTNHKDLLPGLDGRSATARTFVDNYRTPHSEKLHVVERWKMTDDGKMLEARRYGSTSVAPADRHARASFPLRTRSIPRGCP